MSEARHAPATLRNREPILQVLQRILPDARSGPRLLLEIASGTGEHAAYMAPLLPGWTWQPSDFDADALAGIDAHARQSSSNRGGSNSIRPAIRLDVQAADWPVQSADAILCCNMIHIAPWSATVGLMKGAARVLPKGGLLILYGPFKRFGEHTAPSNAAFDADFLRARNPDWGVRCLDSEVRPLAATHGLGLDQVIEMPANNLMVVFGRD